VRWPTRSTNASASLLPTLQWYVSRYSQRADIEVVLDVKELEPRLPNEIEVTLYRVIQEALTNIARHAQAGTVRLSLERDATSVTAVIEDDGRGFVVEELDAATPALEGAGLLGIRDRVSTLGGRAEIRSGPGQGTRIQVVIPL
jgi:signal transduction histidine kinase